MHRFSQSLLGMFTGNGVEIASLGSKGCKHGYTVGYSSRSLASASVNAQHECHRALILPYSSSPTYRERHRVLLTRVRITLPPARRRAGGEERRFPFENSLRSGRVTRPAMVRHSAEGFATPSTTPPPRIA